MLVVDDGDKKLVDNAVLSETFGSVCCDLFLEPRGQGNVFGFSSRFGVSLCECGIEGVLFEAVFVVFFVFDLFLGTMMNQAVRMNGPIG